MSGSCIVVSPYERFTVEHVGKKLNQINLQVALAHPKPFPKLDLLSNYQFKKRLVEILPDGSIQGGYPKMITSLVDFSFIRSLVAHRYSHMGPACYDPPSLFLVDLFRFFQGYLHSSQILSLIRDEDQGRAYRTYAGLSMENLPCEATLSNFRARLGENLYQEIFHVLVGIFEKLGMITHKILSHDGTLFHSWARYKGCTYFCDQCHAITVDDALGKVRNRILYRLNHLSDNPLGSECRVYTECPSLRFPDEDKKPKVELFAFQLAFSDGVPKLEQHNTANLFGVGQELEREHLVLNTIRSNVIDINPQTGAITIACPKLPKDMDAKIGVRRHPQNPDKKEKIFGYNAILSTSLELHLKIELPVAVSCIAGNAEEGDMLIANRERIRQHHSCHVSIDIADSKYDITKNYDYIRGDHSIPVIDYNRRRENLSKEALLKRGYDENGWPFAPCGLLCRPNGFDNDRQRLTFCCFKQCLILKYKALESLQNRFDIAACPQQNNCNGFVKHMSLQDHPRLLNEIPRASTRYKEIKKLRSGSERSNSTLKEDIKILDHPRVIGAMRASILVVFAAICLLCKRGFAFIARVTHMLGRYRQTKDPKLEKWLRGPEIPKSIRNLIQRE